MDPQSGLLLLWGDEATILSWITQGKVRPVAKNNVVRKLEWIGPKIRVITREEEARGYKSSEWRRTQYSYDWETQDNPKNVWAMKLLPNHTRAIYCAVAIECQAQAA